MFYKALYKFVCLFAAYFLFILYTTAGNCGEQQVITWEKFLQAVKEHPFRELLIEELKEKELKIKEASLYPAPSINSEVGGVSLQDGGGRKAIGEVSLSYPLSFFFKTEGRRKLAESEKKQTELLGKEKLSQLVQELREFYLETSYFQKVTGQLESMLRVYEDFLSLLEKKTKNGEMREADLFSFMVEKGKVMDQLENARASHEGKINQLKLWFRDKPAGEVVVEKFFEEPQVIASKETLTERILTRNPELISLEGSIDSAKVEIQKIRGEKIGEITGGTFLRKEVEGISTGLSLEMAFPDFNGNATASEAARSVLKQKELEKKLLVFKLTRIFEALYSEVRNLENRLKYYREIILPNAEKSSKLIETLYLSGEEHFFVALETKKNLKEVNYEYLEILKNYEFTLLKINILTGETYGIEN